MWTSVRRTYFSVEDSQLEREVEPLTETLGMTVSSRAGGDNGWSSFNIYPILSESCGALCQSAKLPVDHANLSIRFAKTMGHTYCFRFISIYCEFFSCQKENS